jgi:hypothetical protein
MGEECPCRGLPFEASGEPGIELGMLEDRT